MTQFKHKKQKSPILLAANDGLKPALGKILAYYFPKFCIHETNLADGNEISVHDMRVAIRRMRVAVQVFQPFIEEKDARYILRKLKHLSAVLGKVRDLDVLGMDLNQFIEQHSDAQILMVWMERLTQQRQLAWRQTVVLFADSEYRQFKNWLADRIPYYCQSNGKLKVRLCDEMPSLLWHFYGRIRKYDLLISTADVEQLHRLRVNCKKLRYLIEFMYYLVGNTAVPLIEQLTIVQDYLGALQDAHFAANMLQTNYIERALQDRNDLVPPEQTILMTYIQSKRDTEHRLHANFGPLWAKLTGNEFRHQLGDVSALI